jgi:hypothetical protein
MAISVNTATDALRITQTGAGNALVVEDSANPDSSPFVVNASGNVGIGTTAPGVKLELEGTASLARFRNSTSSATTSYITVVNVNNSSNGLVMAHIDDGTGYFGMQTNTALRFVTNDTERARITSAGNLGIGTTAPSGRLHISTASGNTEFYHNVTGAGTAARTTYTRDNVIQFYAGLGAWAGTDTYQIASASGPLTTITSAGNLGIGTTAPNTLLELSGSNTGSTSDSPVATLRLTDTDASTAADQPIGKIEFYGSDITVPSTNVMAYILSKAVSTSGGGDLRFGTCTTTPAGERMRLTGAGDLGIGTTAPAFALGSGLEIERAGIATLRLENSTGSNSFEIASDSTTNGIRFYGLNNAPFVFSPNNNERMRLTSAGELLVGGSTAINSSSGFIACEKLNGQSGIALFRNDTSISTGNVFGSVDFYGNDTTANAVTLHAGMSAVASGDHAAGDNPTDILFNTTPDGTGTAAEAGRITQAGSYVLKGGTTTAAAGVGIIFPATQVASANANSLDDYEEGTWTVAFPSGTGTFTSQSARYTKIGRQVFAEWDFTVNTIGTSSASQFSGLPFTQGGSISGGTIAFWSSAANGIIGVGGCYASTTLIYLTGSTTSQTTATDWNAMGNGTRITGAITYTV